MKLKESLFLRTSHTPASGHRFFQFFQRFSRSSKFFSIVETYFSIYFIRLVQTDFLLSGKSMFLVRAILLLVETIIGISSKQSNKDLILASGQVIFWLVEVIFFSIFQRFLIVVDFFRLVETSFSMKSFIETESVNQLASGNEFSGQWKLISFVQRFLVLVETVTEVIESQFLRKGRILTNVTVFLASGNQLLPFFQKAVNCCQWKQLLLQLEQIVQSLIHSVQQK